MAIIDMRPKKGTILYELLRLGLTFESKNLDGHNIWMNYNTQLRSEFNTDPQGNLIEDVKLTDLVTRVSKIVSLEDLTTASSIITWTSKSPLPTDNGDTTDPSINLDQ